MSKVRAYDFEIEYVKGKNNVVVDALTRRPVTFSFMDTSLDWKSQLLVEYFKNKMACQILDGKIQDSRYRVVQDIIY